MADWEIVVYIPSYNSEPQLPELLNRFKKTETPLKTMGAEFKSIIFVNDKSTDNTSSIIKQSKNDMPYIQVIDKEKNEGPAGAIFDGMEAASKEIKDPEKTILIRMDSDLEHNPEDIPRIIKPIIENSAKIVTGYVPFDSRSGHLVVWFNKQIGIMENIKYLDKKIPQFCPGFNAVRGDLYLELLPLLNEKRATFIEMHGKDMLTIDFIILTIAHKLGNEIHYMRLSPIEDKWIKKIPISKIASYFDYHRRTMDFLKKNP